MQIIEKFVIIVLGTVAVVTAIMLLAGEASSVPGSIATPPEQECITFDQFYPDFKAAQAEVQTSVEVARDIHGQAATEWAEITGWAGAVIERALLLIGLDDRDGSVYLMALVVIINGDGCIEATAWFPAMDAAVLMAQLEEKYTM